MQEPTLFNYTVLENILYGKDNALNSEVRAAADIANALEFIESQELSNALDDSAESLITKFKMNQELISKEVGDLEYTELLSLLEDLKKDEIKKGKFIAQIGDIDRRGDEKKD